MSKLTRAKKWAAENPDAVFFGAIAAGCTGLVVWATWKAKSAEPFAVAYHFERLNDDQIRIFRLLENDELRSRIYTRSV